MLCTLNYIAIDNIDTKASITDMNKLLVYETKSGTTDANGVIYVGGKTNYRLLSAVIGTTTWIGVTICSSYSNNTTLYAVRFTYSTGASVANGQNLTFGVIWGNSIIF